MFIRKKTRIAKERGITFDFVAVTSKRTPSGPRQKVIAHLGTIAERNIEHPEYGRLHHRYLWRRAFPKIAAVVEAHIAEQDRGRVRESLIAALSRHVAMP
ncbi:MAG: hypothetical protein WCS31_06130 [Verrucomicrobiae bacterium]